MDGFREGYGQLAQLVEHLLDVQGVRGSSPLLSTIVCLKTTKDVVIGRFFMP